MELLLLSTDLKDYAHLVVQPEDINANFDTEGAHERI